MTVTSRYELDCKRRNEREGLPSGDMIIHNRIPSFSASMAMFGPVLLCYAICDVFPSGEAVCSGMHRSLTLRRETYGCEVNTVQESICETCRPATGPPKLEGERQITYGYLLPRGGCGFVKGRPVHRRQRPDVCPKVDEQVAKNHCISCGCGSATLRSAASLVDN